MISPLPITALTFDEIPMPVKVDNSFSVEESSCLIHFTSRFKIHVLRF